MGKSDAYRALKAKRPPGQGAANSSQGPGFTLGPQPMYSNLTQTSASSVGNALGYSQMSPLVEQYQMWSSGRAWRSLPRPVSEFLEGAFGPLAPIVPVGIDKPREDTGRPDPRRWQFPVGWNMPIGSPGTEGLKLVPFASLRQFAEVSSIARACIEVRKNEILGMDWDIVPTQQSSISMRGSSSAHKDFMKRKETLTEFFRRPDPNFQDYQCWLSALLEDLFAVDAMCAYICPSKDRRGGVLGSNVSEIWAIDGTTMRPLLNIHGGRPRPPAPAYQQYLWGIPRSDNMTVLQNRDIEYMQEELGVDDPWEEFGSNQVLYLPWITRTWTPYGFPPIERAVLPTVSSVKRQQWQLDWFTEGSVPGMFIIPGPEITSRAQQRELQETLNAITGDIGFKQKIVVLPPQSKSELMKPIDLAGSFDEILYQQVLMAFDVKPTEVGLPMGGRGMSGLGGGGMGGGSQSGEAARLEQSMSDRTALRPMMYWLKRVFFDYIIRDMIGQADMEWQWPGLEMASDEESKADTWKTLVSFGALSVDEVRMELGKTPWGLQQTSDPLILGTGGVATPLGNVPPTLDQDEWDILPLVAGPNGPELSQEEQTQRATDHQEAMNHVKPPPGQVPGGKPPAAGVVKPTTGPGSGATPPGTQGPTTEGRANRPAQKALTSAMMNELENLRRYLKKGRPLSGWKPEVLPQEVIDGIGDDLDGA